MASQNSRPRRMPRKSSTKTTISQKKSNRKDRSMYDSLQKTAFKTASDAIRTEFERRSNKRRTMIEQNALGFSGKSDLRRSLRGGVYLFAACRVPTMPLPSYVYVGPKCHCSGFLCW